MHRKRLLKTTATLSLIGAAWLFFLAPDKSFSQAACTSVVGTWNDNFGYTWTLQQDGSGNITGRMNDHELCGTDPNDQWTINGTVDQNTGVVNFTATPDYVCTDPNAIPVSWIQWVFNNAPPGCNSSDQWTAYLANSYGYDDQSWYWGKGCSQPDGEASFWAGSWGDGIYSTAARFNAGLSGGPEQNYGGRTVYEGPGENGTDMCYWEGSAYTPFENIYQPGRWVVGNGSNNYGPDSIGYFNYIVDYYRQVGRVPCTASTNQEMWISCNLAPDLPYKNNWLGTALDFDTVTSSRDGNAVYEPY